LPSELIFAAALAAATAAVLAAAQALSLPFTPSLEESVAA